MVKRRKGCVGRLLSLMMVCVAVAAVALVATNAIVVGTTKSRIVEIEALESETGYDETSYDAIVVLGAAVLPNGRPSGILQDRLDCGVQLYFAGVAPKIIVSGDNGQETYNEVEAMKRYVVEQGVPSEDVFCDHAGFSTYESMYRERHVFGCERIVVVTQTYHLYRALYCAEKLGMEAVGVHSDYHRYGGQVWFSTREALARAKDFVKTILKPESTFVGEPISLDQSGDVTNG